MARPSSLIGRSVPRLPGCHPSAPCRRRAPCARRNLLTVKLSMHSLFSASGARKSDDAALTFLAQGIKAWLEAQLPKYAVIHPVQTSCLKNAVSSSCPSWSVAWPPQPPHVRPRLTLATTRSSRRHAAHVRHRLRRPHRPRLTSEPARTGMAGDGWGWLGMGGDGWGWVGTWGIAGDGSGSSVWQNIDAMRS